MLNKFFRKSCRYDIMWKNIVKRRQTTNDNISHVNCILDTSVYKHAAGARLYIASPKRPDRVWDPLSVLLIAKAAGASSCLPVPFSAEAKNELQYNLLPHMPSLCGQGRITFTFIQDQ